MQTCSRPACIARETFHVKPTSVQPDASAHIPPRQLVKLYQAKHDKKESHPLPNTSQAKFRQGSRECTANCRFPEYGHTHTHTYPYTHTCLLLAMTESLPSTQAHSHLEFMALTNQFELYLKSTYKPLKCPNMAPLSTVLSAVIIGYKYHEPPSKAPMQPRRARSGAGRNWSAECAKRQQFPSLQRPLINVGSWAEHGKDSMQSIQSQQNAAFCVACTSSSC